MSSPKGAAAKTARRPAIPAQPAAKRVQTQPAAKPAGKAADGVSAEARRLAAAVERALASGQRDLLSTEALQALMAAICKVYGARVEAGEQLLPLPERGGATATDVMVTASGLLKAANLAVFELGMWQSWTGR
jgi:cytochrome P450